jgi:5,6-dimethylbenzimidazole synthase
MKDSQWISSPTQNSRWVAMEIEECISRRRDTRHFLSDEVPERVLNQAFAAAHHAPSVGLSEPWRFVVVQDQKVKQKLFDNFNAIHRNATLELTDEKRKQIFLSLKLEAILEAPLGVAVFCEHPATENLTIGIQGTTDAFEWSCACAIQNFWLSLTAQGYSAGWVSILDMNLFKSELKVPETWIPMGYLCVGKPATNYEGIPMLELKKWGKRSSKPVIFYL